MEKIKRLQKMAKRCETLEQYFNEVKKWPKSYGVSMWTKLDYEKVYNQIKGDN